MKNNIYIILAIVAGTVVFLIVFCIWPLMQSLHNDSKDILSMRSNADTLQMQNNEIENFKKNYQTYKPNLETMQKLFIDPQNPVDVIKFLEDTANHAGVQVKISLVQNSQKGNQNFVTFQLSASGNFLNMLNLSEALENGPYLVEIKNVTMSNSGGDTTSKNSPSQKVDATFVVNAFSITPVK